MAVYFIQDGHGHMNIGHSIAPRHRLRALQSARPDALVLARVIEGDQEAEQWFHRHFAANRIRGEWFQFHPEMLTVNMSGPVAQCQTQDRPVQFDAVAVVRGKVRQLGSQMALARLAPLSPQYLTDVLKGRRMVGAKLLKACGYTLVRESRAIA